MKLGNASFNQYNFKLHSLNGVHNSTLALNSSWAKITSAVTITDITVNGTKTEGDVVFLTTSSQPYLNLPVFQTYLYYGITYCLFYNGGSWYEAFRTAKNGDNGDTGPAGSSPQGPQGDTGDSGGMGAPGTYGPQGSQGPQGAQGAQGDNGS